MSTPVPHADDIRTGIEEMLNELAAERDPHSESDPASSINRAIEALKLARRIGWQHGVGLALLQVARREPLREAERTLRRALALFRRLGDRAGEACVLNNLALIYRHQGQNTLAVHFLTTAYHLIRELDDAPAHDQAMLLLNLTVASFEHSSRDAALIVAEEAIDFCRHYHLDEFLVHALRSAGHALWRQGLDQLALQYAQQAVDTPVPDPEIPLEKARAEGTYASIAVDARGDHEAREHGLRAAELFERLHNDYERAVVLLGLGIANSNLEQRDEAERCFEAGVALGSSVGSEYVRACALNLLGDLCIRSGQAASGLVYAGEALAIGERHGDRLVQGLAHAVMYRGAKMLEDSARSLEHLEHALRLAHDAVAVDSEVRFSELPVQRELEALWRQQAVYQMALPMEVVRS
jgi:tetratricopeptide (TPR) repeat protein